MFVFFVHDLLMIAMTDNQRGLAVASRLAEDASITVAVVEAGPNAEHLPEVCKLNPSTPTYPLYSR